jgi:hypothetical protein
MSDYPVNDGGGKTGFIRKLHVTTGIHITYPGLQLTNHYSTLLPWSEKSLKIVLNHTQICKNFRM